MLNEYIYLFLIDLARVPFNEGYRVYAESEPGYGVCMLQAYITAFNENKNGEITEDLIKAIHKDAMAFNSASNPGQYKNDHNHFAIAPLTQKDSYNNKYEVPTYSVTSSGMLEFLQYWIVKNPQRTQSIVFENSINPDNSTHYVIEYHPNGLNFNYLMPSNGSRSTEVQNFEKGFCIINSLLANKDYRCEINPFIYEKEENLQALTSLEINKIIKSYSTEIKKTKSEDEKIVAIVKHVQRIAQLHPFLDGNIRTCYILINKLLNDHGLSLTILMNPNRLDCCSISELLQMVKQGQSHYQQVKSHKEGRLTLLAPQEMPKLLQSITCLPQELYDINDPHLTNNFIDSVILDNPVYISSIDNQQNTRLISNKTQLPFIAKLRSGYYVDATLDLSDKTDSEEKLIEDKLKSLYIPYSHHFFDKKKHIVISNVNVSENVEKYVANISQHP